MSLILISCVMHCCTQVTTFQKDWSELDNIMLDKGRAFCVDMGKAEMHEVGDDGKMKSVGMNPYKCLTKFRKMKLVEENYEQSVVPGYEVVCGKENN